MMTRLDAIRVNADESSAPGSVGRLRILILLTAGALLAVSWFLASRIPADQGSRAGAFQEVQVQAGSGKATVQITVTGFRAGNIDDLHGFSLPSEARSKIPYYVWFTARLTSGSVNGEGSFPIAGDHWRAVSSAGKALYGVRLEGELQPCPHIKMERLSAGEPAEGCFMVFNDTTGELSGASLNVEDREPVRWRF